MWRSNPNGPRGRRGPFARIFHVFFHTVHVCSNKDRIYWDKKPTAHHSDVGVNTLSKEGKVLLRTRESLVLRNGVLYRKRRVSDADTFQLVLQRAHWQQALMGCRDQVGHMGRDHTLGLVHERFYWPGMTGKVVDHVAQCERCIRSKTLGTPRALLVNVATQPMELVLREHRW